MSTRGAFGWRIDGQDKVTYNHFDSYPEGLGEVMMQCAKKFPLDDMANIVRGIKLVDERSRPTQKQIQQCRAFCNRNVSNRSDKDWYCLLRDAQGKPDAWLKQGLRYMIDSKTFLEDSLFCEWAYIIDLDNKVLEIYKGFNKDPLAGRYANIPEVPDNGYIGVGLVMELPIPGKWKISSVLKKLNKD